MTTSSSINVNPDRPLFENFFIHFSLNPPSSGLSNLEQYNRNGLNSIGNPIHTLHYHSYGWLSIDWTKPDGNVFAANWNVRLYFGAYARIERELLHVSFEGRE